jgi:ADP-ribosylglycohydrolase
MLGAIAGDIIGSVHEYVATKTKEFTLFAPECHFTDDTVLTVAVAESLLTDRSYIDQYHQYFHAYPSAGFGTRFTFWAAEKSREPYNSWGNGSAMRVGPVAYALATLEEVLAEAKRSAEPTHNHPEGVKGAQAIAAAVFLARTGSGKGEIKRSLESRFGYDLGRSLDEIRPTYRFTESCRDTVPQAVTAFLEAENYEDAIRNAISLGGDADTLACIAGGIAEAFFGGVPQEIALHAMRILDGRLKRVTLEFYRRFIPHAPELPS